MQSTITTSSSTWARGDATKGRKPAIELERQHCKLWRASNQGVNGKQFLLLAFLLHVGSLFAVTHFTRPVFLRITGALAGGLAAGLSLPLLLAIADAQGWWHCPFLSMPRAQLLAIAAFGSSCAAIALIGWRIDRRFGWRGIVVSLAAVCIIGPPRNYAIAARYPQLMAFGTGVTPIAADAAAYFVTVALAWGVCN
jgi:hypothetical protein